MGTRKQFLQERYQRQPRNLVIGERRSGWKDPAYTDAEDGKYIQVFWFPSFWGKLFLAIYNIYMLKIYPTERLDHPFLFVNLNDRHYGMPYTLHSFLANHRAAVKRIGLPALKRYGTTPHGHRHAMGARMDAAGLPGKIQSLALHHASPFSRLIYNERTVAEVRQELAKVEGRNGGALPAFDPARIEEDVNTWLEAANPALRLSRSR